MEKVFFDTGAFLGIFNPRDKFHEDAKAIFNDIQANKWTVFTSDYIIDETLTLIKIRSDTAKAIIAGKFILDSVMMNRVNIDQARLEETWKIFQKYDDQDFSFTDCSIIAIMHELGINNIFTFDTRLAQIAGINLAIKTS